MTAGRRIALFAAAIVLALAGFIALKPDEASKKQSADPETVAAPPSGRTDTAPERPPSPPVANVRVRNGKPLGGVRELRFGKGQTVHFVVTSDVVDHVHVHGYDVMKDVTPGKPVRFRFRGDIDGRFEVELEDRGVPIAELTVSP